MQLEEKIINEAKRLGFAAAGIAAAGPSETIDLFNKWLADGRAAGMDYLRRHVSLRSDPRELAHGTKSVIVVAARYPVNAGPGKGFSSYARGRDYHAVLGKKLKQLAGFIKKEIRLSVAWACVDSAPILEREWAIRAGIGWRGKQGQVVNPRLGCCLLLGELLVDIELQPPKSAGPATRSTDLKQDDIGCGNCRLCIDACPTGALGEDGLIDARKCISYLTIEHKGDIPKDIQPLIGEAVFGCDFCTAVCPWNRFGHDQVMPELRERKMPDVEECLSMTEVDFEARFKDSPVLRTGLERLQRNAAIALASL